MKIAYLAIALLVMLIITGCSSTLIGEVIENIDKTANIQKIRIGIAAPLTGNQAIYGQWIKEGIELAKQEIEFDNENYKNYKIEFV